MQVAGSTPGLCGSIAAGMKWSGNSCADAEAQLVADRRPGAADLEVADVVRHEAGARAEDRQVAAALAHLGAAGWSRSISRSSSSLIFRSAAFGIGAGSLMPAICAVAPGLQRLGRGGVVAVDVDDHGRSPAWSPAAQAGSMPWRRLASAAAGELMKAEQRAHRLGLRRAGAQAGREGGDDLRSPAGSGPTHVDAVQVHQLAELLEAELDLAARHQRAHRHAGRRLHDAVAQSRRRCPSARTAAAAARRWARWNSRCCARPARPARSAASMPMSGRGAPARTATATGERTRSTRLPATHVARRPSACRWRRRPAPPRRRPRRPARAWRHRRRPPIRSPPRRPPALRVGGGQFGQHLARGHRRDAGDLRCHVLPGGHVGRQVRGHEGRGGRHATSAARRHS